MHSLVGHMERHSNQILQIRENWSLIKLKAHFPVKKKKSFPVISQC